MLAWRECSQMDEFQSLKQLVQRPKTITIPHDWHQRSKTWAASQSGSSTSSDTSSECLTIERDRISRESQRDSFEDNLPLVPILSLPPLTKIKKIRNVRKSDKYHCVVCGDKPTGYHYDVLSCNGCKTFFRRTIIGKRQFVCSKDGQCEFNKDFRCACRACRFEKCVRVGMNQAGNHKFPSPSTANVKKEELDEDDVINQYSPDEMIEEVPCGTSSTQSLSPLGSSPTIEKTEDFEFMQMMTSISESKEIYRTNPLRYWMVTDLQLIVEFAKTFDMFRDLTIEDQQSLISHVGVSMQVCSQSYYSLEQKNDYLVFPDGLDAVQYKLSRGDKREQMHRELYCKPIAMMKELEMSQREFQIFKTLLLFSPYGLDLSERGMKVVERLHYKLVQFLRKLYFHEYGVAMGSAKFAKVIMPMGYLIEVSEKKRLQLHEMYRSLMGVMTVYCTKWPCERNCGLIHKHLMQRKKSSSDLIPHENIEEVGKKERNSSIDQGIFSTDHSFEEDASPRLEQKKEEGGTEERTAEPSQSQPLATPNEQSKNISYLNFRSLYNPSNSIARANSPTLKRVSSDLDSILTDEDSCDYSRLDLSLKRPISSDDSSYDITRRLLDLHIHGSFEQGIHTLDE